MTYISNFASYGDVAVKPMAVVTSVGLRDTVTGILHIPSYGSKSFISSSIPLPRLIWRSKPLESPWKAHQNSTGYGVPQTHPGFANIQAPKKYEYSGIFPSRFDQRVFLSVK